MVALTGAHLPLHREARCRCIRAWAVARLSLPAPVLVMRSAVTGSAAPQRLLHILVSSLCWLPSGAIDQRLPLAGRWPAAAAQAHAAPVHTAAHCRQARVTQSAAPAPSSSSNRACLSRAVPAVSGSLCTLAGWQSLATAAISSQRRSAPSPPEAGPPCWTAAAA